MTASNIDPRLEWTCPYQSHDCISGRGGQALDAYCGRHAQRAALQESYRSGTWLEEPWRRSASPCKDSPRHLQKLGALVVVCMQFVNALPKLDTDTHEIVNPTAICNFMCNR